jgi:hypothetical protein
VKVIANLKFSAVLRIRIQDPVLFYFLDPDRDKILPDPGSSTFLAR